MEDSPQIFDARFPFQYTAEFPACILQEPAHFDRKVTQACRQAAD